ncbi:Cyclin CCL1 [Frankliniella fusca]|uniref:Cyclin CCL1 n=1 Tax=Frankliniella fusca TaxID=407009 RepID=A0AAE1HM80_9NEOP|nr:Cyclin CCL1 [Frankliniella fusca]
MVASVFVIAVMAAVSSARYDNLLLNFLGFLTQVFLRCRAAVYYVSVLTFSSRISANFDQLCQFLWYFLDF